MNIRKIEETKERKRTTDKNNKKEQGHDSLTVVLIILDKCHCPGSGEISCQPNCLWCKSSERGEW